MRRSAASEMTSPVDTQAGVRGPGFRLREKIRNPNPTGAEPPCGGRSPPASQPPSSEQLQALEVGLRPVRLLLNDAAKCLRDEGAAGSMERDGYPPSIRVLVPAMTPSLRSQDESIGKKNADHLARGQRPQFRITMAMETG